MDTSNWTVEDYKAFALLYAAHVDGELHDDEMEMIEEVVGKERASKINKEGKKLSDYECLQVLSDKREKFYPGENGKEMLLSELSDLFAADGNFSQFEKAVLRNLKRAI